MSSRGAFWERIGREKGSAVGIWSVSGEKFRIRQRRNAVFLNQFGEKPSSIQYVVRLH
jgi:hypothetical protein